MIRRPNNRNLALEYNHVSTAWPQVYLNNDTVLEYNHRSTDQPTKIFLSKSTLYQLNTTEYTQQIDETYQDMMDRNQGCHDENYQEFEVYAQRRNGNFLGAGANGEQYCEMPDDEDEEEETDEDDDESDTTDASDTEYLKLQAVPHGFIINSDVFLTTDQWNCLIAIPNSETQLYCAICAECVEIDSRAAHVADAAHARNMEVCAPMKVSELSVIRKIGNNYHCGVCNELFDESVATTHFETKQHEDKKLFAYNKASDITYDYKLDDSDRPNNSFNKNKRNFKDKRIGNQNNQDEDNRVIEYNPNDPNNGYGDNGYGTGCPPPTMSYASMAKKAQAKALPTFLRVDLGNRVIEVRFDAWHMIVYARGSLHCMACNVTAPRSRRADHCRAPEHLSRLRACRVLPEYQGHLVRQVDDYLYHCGHCNNLKPIQDMEDHILDNHPTITKVTKHIPPSPNNSSTATKNNTESLEFIPKSTDSVWGSNASLPTKSITDVREIEAKSGNNNFVWGNHTSISPKNMIEVKDVEANLVWGSNASIAAKNNTAIQEAKSANNNVVRGTNASVAANNYTQETLQGTNNSVWGENASYAVKNNADVQAKSTIDNVVWRKNAYNTVGQNAPGDSKTVDKNQFDVASTVKSLTGRNFFSTRKIGANDTNKVGKDGLNDNLTFKGGAAKTFSHLMEDNKENVNKNLPQKAFMEGAKAQINKNIAHIENSVHNAPSVTFNGIQPITIETKIPETQEMYPRALQLPQNSPHSPMPPQNLPQLDPNTQINMFIFGQNVTINLLAMNTIVQLGGWFVCSLCDAKLALSGLVDHILHDSTHKERLDGTPFIPEFLCNLIRPIRCTFLHCALCNGLLPYDKTYVHNHVTSPSHVELLHRSVPSLVSPSKVAGSPTVCQEASDSNAEDPNADKELTEYTLAKLKKIYIKIETLAWHSLLKKGDGDLYCFVCELTLSTDDVPTHVRKKRHCRNIERYKILGNNYGTNLLRQMGNRFHCLICNVVTCKENLQRHLEWSPHTESCHTSFDRDARLPVKEVLTQKQINTKQTTPDIIIEYDVIIDKSTDDPEQPEQGVNRLNRIVQSDGVLFRIKWENWHGLSAFKDGYKCKLCQVDIKKFELASHVTRAVHVDLINNAFVDEYKHAVMRSICETRVHCLLCNIDLSLTENLGEHVNGKRHNKHREQILEESSRVNAFADCDKKNIVFI